MDGEKRVLTAKEALEITLGILEGISVPVKQMENIGAPLATAAANIREIIRAMEQDSTAEEAEEIVRDK